MNDGTLALVTSRPESAPKRGPTARGSTIPNAFAKAGDDASQPCGAAAGAMTVSHPRHAPVSPTIAPTETSSSPAMMMIVIPAATRRITTSWPSRLLMLTGERNLGRCTSRPR